jgi:hypothetical protein
LIQKTKGVFLTADFVFQDQIQYNHIQLHFMTGDRVDYQSVAGFHSKVEDVSEDASRSLKLECDVSE